MSCEKWIEFLTVNKNYCEKAKGEEKGIEKATILGYFSKYPDERIEVGDLGNLRYFKMPKYYPIDLNENKIVECDYTDESSWPVPIDHLLQFLAESNLKLKSGDIVTSLYVLTALMTTPYDVGCEGQNWTVRVMKFNGKLYLILLGIMGQRRQRIRLFEPQLSKNITSNHYKFLKCCSTTGRDEEVNCPCPSEYKFSCVFHRKLGNLSIVYAGDIQLAEGDDGNLCTNIEQLKNAKFISTRVSTSTHKGYFYKKKLLRYYCKFMLSNVQTLVQAQSTKDNIIESPPQLYKVSALKELSKNIWDESVCVEFLIEILSKIQRLMMNIDSLEVAYEFEFNSFLGLIKYRILEGSHLETKILSQFYIDFENSLH